MFEISINQVKVNELDISFRETGLGIPIIFLHGLGGSSHDWVQNIPPLVERFRILALDLPGFGSSPPPFIETPITFEYTAKVINDFLNTQNCQEVILIGNSMGGGIALRFAIDYPKRTKALILANGAGLGREIDRTMRILSIPGIAKLMLKRVTRQDVENVWKAMFMNPEQVKKEMVDRTWDWIRRPLVQQFLCRVYRHGATVFGQKNLLVDEITKITAPTLITWGKDDQVLPISHAYKAHQLILNSRIHVFESCGHVPQIDKTLEFNRVISDFLHSLT